MERDLDLKNLDTYGSRFTPEQARLIAGYISGFLPADLPLAALTHIDRIEFIDKEIRASKGRWEKVINSALERQSGLAFRKTKFQNGGEGYELDSAFKQRGVILYGVDVKRIEARRDTPKRADEIVNKAANLKAVYPNAKYGAVIYYPFAADQGILRSRLQSQFIDSVQFAGESESSVSEAIQRVLIDFGLAGPAKPIPE